MAKKIKRSKEYASDIKETINKEIIKDKIGLENFLSTGSTLLDLAISGKKTKNGGIPSGNIVEIFGPSSVGKTALLAEIAASAQAKGGEVKFLDPEARLDREYARIYGLELEKKNYHMPDTVKQLFSEIYDWEPKNDKVVNLIAADSLAALSTEMEMESEDKMGMKRAKDFSEGLRKTCRIIKQRNWLIVCSNQEREGKYGITTPGGKGIPYHASLRIRIFFDKPSKIEKNVTFEGKKISKTMGIKSICRVVKSSVDEPQREAKVTIKFNYGIDSIRDELQFLKDTFSMTKYLAIDKEFVSVVKAIKHIEDNNYENKLKEEVIRLWNKREDAFIEDRKKKIR